VGAASDFAALGLAWGSGEGGAGEHAVLRCYPAATGVTQPSRDAVFDGCVAEDAGVAGFYENGALGSYDVSRGEADGAECVGCAVAGTEEEGGGGTGHSFDYRWAESVELEDGRMVVGGV
jgi:hypothetical protein